MTKPHITRTSDRKFRPSEEFIYSVRCISCGAESAWSATEELALAAWNHRVDLQNSQSGKGKV